MGALQGLKVLDFSQAMAGPSCGMLLGDFGAEVIKIEPPEGEPSRRWGVARFGERSEMSGLYAALNRNKLGIVLDLKSPEGRQAIEALMSTADVILENFRPGVADRIGVGYQQARLLKPDIIYCSISGFGQTGPMRDRAGLDMLLQAFAGHMSITGEAGRSSVRSGPSPIDLLTGAHAAFAIMVALHHRGQTGLGQYLDLSLYDTAVHMVSHYIADYTGGGPEPTKHGPYFAFLAPYGVFWGSDREFFIGPDSRSYANFCTEIGVPELIGDPRFVTNADRLLNRDALHSVLVPLLKTRPAKYWLDLCHRLGIPANLIETIPEVIEQEQALARDMIVECGAPGVKSAGIPMKLERTPGSIRRGAPSLGGDNEAVLSQLSRT